MEKQTAVKELIEKLKEAITFGERYNVGNDNELAVLVRVKKLQEAIEALEKQSEWISVEDRLPEKEQGQKSVYVWCNVYCPNIGVIARPYNTYHESWDDEDMDDHFSEPRGGKVTHWMPLPNKPIVK